ncbi:cation:proton antiporter domain-containing protein [Streptomyces specialis]|uniref:cation:proton antiporter domain-containing protein n=1 Tax=Streptomyces specialis TaxID=498367 RepID=UPI00073E344E|nr:cation:proton antiporter [Streptomyces specialis]
MAAADGLPMEAIVLADIALVLLAGAVMVKLGRRLHQPPVVAEIATGIMLGPSVLGLLPGDLPARIFPHDGLSMLSAIAQVGLALFMFLAGWELDLSLLRGRGRAVGTMAGLAMAVPFVLGLGAAALLFGSHGADGVSASSFVLYLATAFSITAFPVLARIIKDSRLSNTRVGTMAMACAAIGDVVAWCVLVLVIAVADAGGAGQFVSVVAWTVAYGLGMALIARPVLHRLVRRATLRGDTAPLLILVVAGVFLSAYATSLIGIHAIFGAFAFGLIMPHGHAPALHEHVAFPLEKAAGILLPVFFVITGLSVDIGALGTGGLLSLALVIAAAVIGKFAGAALPARLSGMSWREAGAFGALMNTRGLTEIVILDIGRELGLIDAEMFTMMVLMALLTTTMAGPLLRVLRVGPADLAAGGVPSPAPGEPPGAPRDAVATGAGRAPVAEGTA